MFDMVSLYLSCLFHFSRSDIPTPWRDELVTDWSLPLIMLVMLCCLHFQTPFITLDGVHCDVHV